MAWVKEWDYCVFGRKRGKKRGREEDCADEWRRPQERVRAMSISCEERVANHESAQIMLISGPPGLGKTTLAHVVAKQAGYSVYEINARYAAIPLPSQTSHMH